MRIHQIQNTQRVYDDIRVSKIVTSLSEQELLTDDLLSANEEVHLFEVIASHPCQVVFTFSNGKESHPKQIATHRVVTFENLRPIKSVRFIGEAGTTLDIAFAV